MEKFIELCGMLGLDPDNVLTIKGEQTIDGQYVVVVTMEPAFSESIYASMQPVSDD
ncbi:hypothetical protein UFOVP1246_92 [uncultured Caudovirales phage]|jgi:hypothetical protein|uniref:Uncharacterized protein n=1 Tax=uncultured Caudovirales phage TaxID=2100421 RepID=A0A6J5RGN6_9CAUD|nr:hypothetical protein UFOVP1246_92 [uncultured Caudovirales phage]